MRWITALLSLLAASACLAEVATIHLIDGSQVRGEVVSLKGGQYTIKGDSLGTLRIDQNNIRLVEYGASATASGLTASQTAAASNSATIDLQQLQNRLMQDPALMSKIQALQSDPQIQAIIADPDIQRAIANGDYNTLLAHPKLIELMRNKSVSEIAREVQAP